MTNPFTDSLAPGRAALPATIYAQGFSWRKRAIVRRFVAPATVRFVSKGARVPPQGTLLLWGSKQPPAGIAPGVKLVRLEDGFLRSVGLGADLVRPVSWVLDQRGIYYDATQPSDLEVLLQTTEFSDSLLARAGRLRARIVNSGLSKYNVGKHSWARPATQRRIILVAGQVETDASLQFGAPGVYRNIDLLRAARLANPEAYLLYKPHPDVVAGLRARGEDEYDVARHCDEVVLDSDISEVLAVVDEVHVMTSLAGFEALLRGKPVVCYGQPFYAGWGLTTDMLPHPRRKRAVPLDGLVAATLILYPTYISRQRGAAVITPEQALDELLAWRSAAHPGLPLWRKMLRHILGFARSAT